MESSPPREVCLCIALRRATRAATRFYDDCMKGTGLKVTQYSLLANIDRAGSIKITDLARKVDMERTAMGRNLSLLEKKRLVHAEGEEGDLRGKLYSLTKAGRSCLEAARPSWRKAQTEMRRKLRNHEFPALEAVAGIILGKDV